MKVHDRVGIGIGVAIGIRKPTSIAIAIRFHPEIQGFALFSKQVQCGLMVWAAAESAHRLFDFLLHGIRGLRSGRLFELTTTGI